MKKKKQGFSKLNKTKIARLNLLQISTIVGGTEIENTITDCDFATCDDGDDGDTGSQTGDRSNDIIVCGRDTM